jgi:hypothetical protein
MRVKSLRLRLSGSGSVGRELLQLLLPVWTVQRSVIEAAFRGGAPFTFDEADVYVTADLALKPLVTASGVGELPENVQGDGLSVRQLPTVTP